MHLHSTFLVYFTRLTCSSLHNLQHDEGGNYMAETETRHHSHIIFAQIYQFLEEYLEGEFDFLHSNHNGPYWYIWCQRYNVQTCALQCTYCTFGIRSLILAWTPLWIPDLFAVSSYPCVLILSITMPKFRRLDKTTQQNFHR